MTTTTAAAAAAPSEAPSTPALFQSKTIRGVEFANRIGVSPMCQYSCHDCDGKLTDWHLVNLGSRCFNTGLELVEATAVEAVGRISPQCPGLWEDGQIEGHKRLADFVHRYSKCKIGVQLAHAGRKGSSAAPAVGRGGVSVENGGWVPVSSTAVPFSPDMPTPRAMTLEEIRTLVDVSFPAAIKRAETAGFDFIEIHGAHGYLLHQFYSPLVNDRKDDYGGSFDNRIRLLLEVTTKARALWSKPLFVRISCSDWAEGGWDIEQSVELAKRLKAIGVDVVDCSSGGGVSHQKIAVGPLYQLPFSERIRKDADIATATVGLITKPSEAETIVASGQADFVLLAREFLRQPYFALRAAEQLQAPAALQQWPAQYHWAVGPRG